MRKSFKPLVSACLAVAVATSMAGCAFTQWTDRYYFGTAGGPPVYENRTMTGVVILPFALIGDVITSPIQVILMAIMGDEWIYSKRTRATFVSSNDEALRSMEPAQREQLFARLEEAMVQAAAQGRRDVAFGIDAAGNVVEVPLTQEQAELISTRVNGYVGSMGGYAALNGGKLPLSAK